MGGDHWELKDSDYLDLKHLPRFGQESVSEVEKVLVALLPSVSSLSCWMNGLGAYHNHILM